VATQGQAVIAGQVNSATHGTGVYNTESGFTGCQPGGGSAAGFVACGNIGVQGRGTTTGPGGIPGTGIDGEGSDYGVRGFSTTIGSDTYGVEGSSVTGTGVYGHNTGASGIGVYGKTGGVGSAVYGEATANGAGVFGDTTNGTGVQARSTNGAALNVLGKAKFSRSGIVTVSAGTASKTVTLAGVTTSSMVLATAQQNASAHVKAAIPGSGSFTIRLTANAPTGGLKVAYFVLN